MCGRYASIRPASQLAALFEAVDLSGEVTPRYNLAPTDPAPVVRWSDEDASRVLVTGRWGLLPPWARDPRVGSRMINARSETVATSRAYASAFARRRALVPADGWYEWRREGGRRQAYFLTPHGGEVLAMAGLWSCWGPDRVLTFTVVTAPATGALVDVHSRMPLLLPPDRWQEWLCDDPSPHLLRPTPESLVADLEIRPVGPAVGDVRRDGPELLTRVEPPTVQQPLW